MTVGIFGGTFNPVHNGHIKLAEWIVNRKIVDEVWLVLSPANPLKPKRPGATDQDRKDMLAAACEGVKGVAPCLIEFDLPRPSYSINTLLALKEKYPAIDFRIIIGADNWLIFNKWREYERILENFAPIIYPRPGSELSTTLPQGVTALFDAPQFPVSSTLLRKNLCSDLVPQAVANIIKQRKLYANR